MNRKGFLELAEAREKIYRFLSSMFLQVPNMELVEKLTSKEFTSFLNYLTEKCETINEMKDGLEKIKNFIETSRKKSKEELCEELAVIYTRLFRGIKRGYSPPPPYESVYREGKVMGESTIKVMRKYAQGHAEVLGFHKERIPDSIELELGFMSFLCSKEVKAWKNGDQKEVLKYLEMEKSFLENHILQWFPKFCKEAERICKEIGKEADFYLGVIRMTRNFTSFDRDLSQMIINDLEEGNKGNDREFPS
jgi:TorA maturation chaperone TorD